MLSETTASETMITACFPVACSRPFGQLLVPMLSGLATNVFGSGSNDAMSNTFPRWLVTAGLAPTLSSLSFYRFAFPADLVQLVDGSQMVFLGTLQTLATDVSLALGYVAGTRIQTSNCRLNARHGHR